MHLLAFLDLFTDGNDIFPYPFIYLTSEIPSLSYTWSLKRLPLLGGAFPYRPLYRVPPTPPPPNSPEGSVMYANDKWWWRFTPSLGLHHALRETVPLDLSYIKTDEQKFHWQITFPKREIKMAFDWGVVKYVCFENLPFQTFDLFLIDCEPLYPFLFFPSQHRCPVTALFYYYYEQANFGNITFL